MASSNLNKAQRAVPSDDSTDNVDLRDVAGSKADAAVGTVGSTASLVAYLKQTLNQTVGSRRLAIGNWNFTDDGGANPTTHTVYTITGEVLLAVFAVCKVAITSGGAPTIELGVSGSTAALIAQIVDGTDLIANEVWHDATPTLTIETLDILGSRDFVIANGQDAIFTIGNAAITAGDIDIYGLWTPLSTDGNVVAA